MAKLIDADRLKELLKRFAAKLETNTASALDGAEGEIAGATIEEAEALMAGTIATLQTVATLVDRMPDAGRYGRWICRGDFAPGMWECDVCRKWCMVKGNVYRYCPSCGARMEVGDE